MIISYALQKEIIDLNAWWSALRTTALGGLKYEYVESDLVF